MFLGRGLRLVFVQTVRPRALVQHRVGFGLPVGLVAAFLCRIRRRRGLGLRVTPQAASVPVSNNSANDLTM